MRKLIGLLAHRNAGGQPINVVQGLTLFEVLEWAELLSEISELTTPKVKHEPNKLRS